MLKTKLRTHGCGELTSDDTDSKVSLCGWVHSRRDHGGIIFIDLRDRYGLTQIVFDPEISKQAHKTADRLRREDTIKVDGIVRKRKEGMINKKLVTGEIEVFIDSIEMLNKSEVPPIEIDDRIEISDDIRLKYRYLDLRRPMMQQQIKKKHLAMQAARNFLNKRNFLEIQTPMLVKATPEGARDYIVPSRVNPGKFYALPQSPQLYKQILMVSGFDRYYQFPICLRDEDLRQDRQPEFIQLDAEMSFVEQEDVFEILEGCMQEMFDKASGIKIKIPFPRLSYQESMDRFGTDKPDMRFSLELTDVSAIVKDSDFGVFKSVVEAGGIVKCINPEKELPRKEIDRYISYCQEIGSKGMAWMRVTDKGLESNIAKFFSDSVQKRLLKAVNAKPGSILMFIADKPKACNEIIAKLRNRLGKDLGLYDKNEFNFIWIVDFPLFEWDDDINSWTPAHHMFTMPKKEHLKFMDKNPEKVLAQCYDLVLNGVELASGSIRCNNIELQEKIMDIVGFPKEKAEERFGFLLDSFRYGAPPHGGFGLGFDRLVAMMCGYNDIREVIPFPKNKSAQCPMDGSPSDVDADQLKELHVKLDIAKK